MRIITTFILLLSVIMLPWYITAPCIVLAVLYFNEYYEALVAGIAFDALYGVSVPYLSHMAILGSLFFSGVFCIVEFLKPRLRFYLTA